MKKKLRKSTPLAKSAPLKSPTKQSAPRKGEIKTPTQKTTPTLQKTMSAPKSTTPNIVKPASLADILGTSFKNKQATTARAVPPGVKKYHDQLIQLRAEKDEQLYQLRESYQETQSESSSEIYDTASQNQASNAMLSLIENTKRELTEINAAIERIFSGQYGICEKTGTKIEARRLEVVPFTRYSQAGEKMVQQELQMQKIAQKHRESMEEEPDLLETDLDKEEDTVEVDEEVEEETDTESLDELVEEEEADDSDEEN